MSNEVDIGLRKTILGNEHSNHITVNLMRLIDNLEFTYDKTFCRGTFNEAYR